MNTQTKTQQQINKQKVKHKKIPQKTQVRGFTSWGNQKVDTVRIVTLMNDCQEIES